MFFLSWLLFLVFTVYNQILMLLFFLSSTFHLFFSYKVTYLLLSYYYLRKVFLPSFCSIIMAVFTS